MTREEEIRKCNQLIMGAGCWETDDDTDPKTVRNGSIGILIIFILIMAFGLGAAISGLFSSENNNTVSPPEQTEIIDLINNKY